MQMQMDISFEDAVSGVSRQVGYENRVTCEECTGLGAQPGSKSFSACPVCSGSGCVGFAVPRLSRFPHLFLRTIVTCAGGLPFSGAVMLMVRLWVAIHPTSLPDLRLFKG